MRQAGPRFTIRSLMIAIAVVAGLLALAVSPNELPSAIGLLFLSLYLSSIGVVWWMFKGLPRLAAFCFGVVVTTTFVWCAVFCVYLLNSSGFAWMFIGWLSGFPMILGTGCVWATAVSRRSDRSLRSALLACPLVLLSAFAPLSMLQTPWPLRLAFLASRPAMERLANRVALGERISRPEWAGVFRVIGSSLEPGSLNVGLIIDGDPAGRSGFVRLGAGVPETDTYVPFYVLNVNEPLGKRWFYQSED